MSYVKTNTFLDRILAQKSADIAASRAPAALARHQDAAQQQPPPRDFTGAIQRRSQSTQPTLALIAEVKKASPSKGLLLADFDPARLATTYAANGAAAISVLTDAPFFQGSLDDLRAVRAAVDVPVLRKDFVIDACQVYEARAAGADAVLLIAAALDDRQMADLHALITELGMAALVEIHDESELERTLSLGASLLGINNRDLRSFNVDLNTTARLAALVPDDVTLVAESGIGSPADVRRMGELGAHAVLVGEALVTADDIGATVRQFSDQPRIPR